MGQSWRQNSTPTSRRRFGTQSIACVCLMKKSRAHEKDDHDGDGGGDEGEGEERA